LKKQEDNSSESYFKYGGWITQAHVHRIKESSPSVAAAIEQQATQVKGLIRSKIAQAKGGSITFCNTAKAVGFSSITMLLTGLLAGSLVLLKVALYLFYRASDLSTSFRLGCTGLQ
jgi:hypothetical protein